MRIALVCPYAWDRYGGVQSHVRALAHALNRSGHETGVMAPYLLDHSTLNEPGITFVGRAVRVPANGSVAPLAFGPLVASGIREALEEFEPEVVHLHEPLIPSLSLLALSTNASAPTVGTFHAAAESSLGYRGAKAVLAKAANRLTVRTAVSEAAKALAARYFPGDYLITPNGIDVERFASAEPLGPARGRPGKSVLFLGRLESRKGLEVLIEAMAGISDLDASLVVAGSGPEKRSARALARRLGVKVEWLGRVSEADKPRIYRSADVYCAPALGGESFGIVLIEAMAAGAPVVCSDLSAFRAVTAGAAELVPPGEPEALAKALRAVLADPRRSDEMRALSHRGARRFSWTALVGDVEAAYRLALSRGPVVRTGRLRGSG
ncbi:MAG: glycosyltransferase family 4 protein [Actinobacteria bacterium]|nr:glycosyltransferase family 4 protein [Actinomycetota bacterium]MDQ3533439.1 glycosyltransferase family 4 protein [Actinomycetota bacterium]